MSSPNFSLSGASGVTAELLRDAYWADSSGVDTLTISDTITYVPIVEHFAVPEGEDASGNAVAVQSNSPFDTPIGTGYWSTVDSTGTYYGLRVETGESGSWVRITTLDGEDYSSADSRGIYEAQWSAVTGGWVLESSIATLITNDGSELTLTASLASISYAAAPGAPILDGVLATVNSFRPGALAAEAPVFAQGEEDCDDEIRDAAIAGITAAGMWAMWRIVPTPWAWRRAVAATGVAVAATLRAAVCTFGTDEQADPGS